MRKLFTVIALLSLWSSTALGQTAVQCSTNAQGLAGDPGVQHNVVCPAGCGSATIWGTGVYSDDSAVCSAAIHAGVLTAAAGGAITVTIVPGLAAYVPTAANGITSSEWGSWGRSFTVTGSATAIDCSTNAQGLAGDPGTQLMVLCPAGCGSSTIWGTAMYSDDSSVCSAGIHSGAIAAATGGAVLVTIRGGLMAYPSAPSNGITSNSWAEWGRSFTAGVPAGTCTDACGSSGDGECDDGGAASLYALCALGSDCTDCGSR